MSIVVGVTPLPTKTEPPLSREPTAPKISATTSVQKLNIPSAPQVDETIPVANETPAPDPAPVSEPEPAPSQPVPAPTGTCANWMANAGISDVADATLLLNWESHCNPNAVNPSSGACGLAQELPCGKSGCSLGDGSCQMVWFNQYVLGRYGSMAAAVAFHEAHGWY